ncbi:MAG: hypothetical protein CMH62_01165, partial [Nanoarchaeota archaeon]|nr:hypothetical protein [Nanoarchaeota archaeon]
MSKILLSTDIGSDIDDALALQVMFNHPGIDLRGIYTVNDRMDVRPFIAKHIVNLTGRDIPVVKGESRALSGINPYYYFEDCVVDDEYIDEEESECSSDVVLKPFEKVGITSDGGEDLASRLEKERHVVFS